MPAQWTGDIIRQMHLNRITGKRLAAAIGWNDKYLSQVLNGHANPKNAEQKVRTALEAVLQESDSSGHSPLEAPATQDATA